MVTPQQIALMIAERVRDIATRQGSVPFKTGDLRKSVVVQPFGNDGAVIGSNLPYARAVHDGRPQLTIYPKGGKKALKFKIGNKTVFAKKVVQPARKGRPFLREAMAQVEREGPDFLEDMLEEEVLRVLRRSWGKVFKG